MDNAWSEVTEPFAYATHCHCEFCKRIAGGYGTRFQSAAAIGAALIGAELHGFGKEYLANYAVALDRVDGAHRVEDAPQHPHP